MSDVVAHCYSCGAPLSQGLLGRSEICPGCRRDTRVCLNCRHYERGRQNDCREPQADRVVEKEKSNFCDFFIAGAAGHGSGRQNPDAARKAAEALFKKK